MKLFFISKVSIILNTNICKTIIFNGTRANRASKICKGYLFFIIQPEQIRDQKRAVDRSKRALEREKNKLERDKKKSMAEIKKMALKGQHVIHNYVIYSKEQK